MAHDPLDVGILIISDTAYRAPSSDRTGSILRDLFSSQENGKWNSCEIKFVPDRVHDIQVAVTQWTDSSTAKHLVVTSGGTGFAVADHTPEAISPLIQKHATGLVHGMLAASAAITPFALMARPVAGIRLKSLIITLPGSPKGAKENLEAVIRLLPHACQQATGADSRSLHQGGVEALEKDAGLSVAERDNSPVTNTHRNHHHPGSHEHSHRAPVQHTAQGRDSRSNNPYDGPSARHRVSPYPMLSVAEALDTIRHHIPKPIALKFPFDRSVIGGVLAEDITANEAVPAFRASIVDGYAIMARHAHEHESNTKGIFPVAFASHAHAGTIPNLQAGQVARITTGAPIPPGANAVVMVEDTRLIGTLQDGHEEAEVEILTADVEPGENVREIGSDVQVGEVVMSKGDCISAIGGEFGLLASVGIKDVLLYQRPIVGILSTGDEIVPYDQARDLAIGEVRDTNRPTLLTTVESSGFKAVDLGIAKDRPEELESILRSSLSMVDVLITSGGVSMGELDLLKPTLERSLGGTIHFGRVSMKPGKPTTFATVPCSNLKAPGAGTRGRAEDQKVVFSLPGNPASAIVTFMLFVLPALRQMGGMNPAGLPEVSVRLSTDVRCDQEREEYHRATVFVSTAKGTDKEYELRARSTGGQRSSKVGSFKGSNALLRLPAGGGLLEKGSHVTALLMSSIQGMVVD